MSPSACRIRSRSRATLAVDTRAAAATPRVRLASSRQLRNLQRGGGQFCPVDRQHFVVREELLLFGGARKAPDWRAGADAPRAQPDNVVAGPDIVGVGQARCLADEFDGGVAGAARVDE